MGKTALIIKKNLRILTKSKASIMFLIFSPLLIIALFSFFYNFSTSYNVYLGYSTPDGNFTDQFIEELTNEGFLVTKFDSKEECIDKIEIGRMHACIIFPLNFKIQDGNINDIDIFIDNSKSNIKNVVEKLVIKSFNTKVEEIQKENTNELLSVLGSNENFIETQQNTIKSLLDLQDKIKENNVKFEKNIDLINDMLSSTNEISNDVNTINVTVNNYIKLVEELINDTDGLTDELDDLIDTYSNGTGNDLMDGVLRDIENNINSMESRLSLLENSNSLKNLNSNFGNFETSRDELEELIEDLKRTVNQNKKIISDLDVITYNLNFSNSVALGNITGIDVKDLNTIVKPLNLHVKEVIPEENVGNFNASFPSLIVSLVMILALFIPSSLILTEKNSPSNFRNYLTVANSFQYLMGDLLALVIILFSQIFMVLLVYYFLFLSTNFSIFILFIILVIITAFFILFGMLIGQITKNETVNVTIIFLVIFCLALFSGFLIPLEYLPKAFLDYIYLNPYLIGESMVRKFVLFQMQFSQLRYETIVLSIYILILFLINFFIVSINRKRFIYQFFVSSSLKYQKKREEKKIFKLEQKELKKTKKAEEEKKKELELEKQKLEQKKLKEELEEKKQKQISEKLEEKQKLKIQKIKNKEEKNKNKKSIFSKIFGSKTTEDEIKEKEDKKQKKLADYLEDLKEETSLDNIEKDIEDKKLEKKEDKIKHKSHQSSPKKDDNIKIEKKEHIVKKESNKNIDVTETIVDPRVKKKK